MSLYEPIATYGHDAPGPAWMHEVDHLGQVLEHWAEHARDRAAIRFDSSALTFEELERETRTLALRFRAGGVAASDRVGVLLPNSLDYVLAWLALGRLGAVVVGLNPGYKEESLVHVLSKSGASSVLASDALRPQVESIRNRLPELRRVLGNFDSLPEAAEGDALPMVAAGDPWLYFFTSGTTGLPKAVEVSHRFGLNMALDVATCARLTPEDVTYSCFPMYHAEAPLCNLLSALIAGATGALGVKFSATGFWDEIRSHRATFFTHLGSIIPMLDKQPARAEDRDNLVTRSYGFPTPQNWREIEQRFGFKLLEWGGSSEAGIVTAERLDEGHRDGCSGPPLWHSAVKLVDGHDREVAAGEVGEIVTRPLRPFGMMTRYAGDPEATCDAFRNLWFRSGDLASFDEGGRLRYVGRTKDMIRRRGVNISPLEVEQTVSAHLGVVDCAAIGVPSELGEEDLKIVIQVRPDLEVEIEEVIEFIGRRLPRAMLPRYVELTDALPRTSTGKVQKASLKERWETPVTYDREAGRTLGSPEAMS